MKISELIQDLESLKEEHGDMEVIVYYTPNLHRESGAFVLCTHDIYPHEGELIIDAIQ